MMRKISLLTVLIGLSFFYACEQDTSVSENIMPEESSLSGREKIRELEADLEVAEWENARLSLKIRKVNGASLVRDKSTNLWHYDVERTPFTGLAVEEYANGKPRAEAHFLDGQKDGMERFWYPTFKVIITPN